MPLPPRNIEVDPRLYAFGRPELPSTTMESVGARWNDLINRPTEEIGLAAQRQQMLQTAAPPAAPHPSGQFGRAAMVRPEATTQPDYEKGLENVAKYGRDIPIIGGIVGGIAGTALSARDPNAPKPANMTDRDKELLSPEEVEKEYGWTGLKYDRPMPRAVVEFDFRRKREEFRANEIVANAPAGITGTALRFGAEIVANVKDPINLASAFVPVVGEAKFAAWASRWGLTRARLARGALEGVAGAAIVEPFTYGLSRELQLDYDMTDSLMNLVGGAALGFGLGGLHVAGGFLADRLIKAAKPFHAPHVEMPAEFDRPLIDTLAGGIAGDRRWKRRRWVGEGVTMPEDVRLASPEANRTAIQSAVTDMAEHGRTPDVRHIYAADAAKRAVVTPRVADVSVHDAHRGEMFGEKVVYLDGKPVAAADVNILGDEVRIQNIATIEKERGRGHATRLVDDLFREFPDKRITTSLQTPEGNRFFSQWGLNEDGSLQRRTRPEVEEIVDQWKELKDRGRGRPPKDDPQEPIRERLRRFGISGDMSEAQVREAAELAADARQARLDSQRPLTEAQNRRLLQENADLLKEAREPQPDTFDDLQREANAPFQETPPREIWDAEAAQQVDDESVAALEKAMADARVLDEEPPAPEPVIEDVMADKPAPEYEDQIAPEHPAPDQIKDAAGLNQMPGNGSGLDAPFGFFVMDASKMATDAEAFQYKSEGDVEGVTKRLSGVSKWDRVKAGQGIAWLRKDGTIFIVDGHQRTGLARRIKAANPEAETLMTFAVYREIDGVTPTDAMTIAAAANLAQIQTPGKGAGGVLDVAKIARVAPQIFDETMPLSDAAIQTARNLTNLSDDTFGMVINEVVPYQYAAAVGRMLPDDEGRQLAAMDLMAKAKPGSLAEAESMVRSVRDEGIVLSKQETLFGEETIASSLIVEKSKVEAAAERLLKQDKRIFRTLQKDASVIEAAGNVLAADVNAERALDASALIELIQKLANRKGAISDALTEAAKQVREGKRPSQAARSFIDGIRGEAKALSEGGRRVDTEPATRGAGSENEGLPKGVEAPGIPEDAVASIRAENRIGSFEATEDGRLIGYRIVNLDERGNLVSQADKRTVVPSRGETKVPFFVSNDPHYVKTYYAHGEYGPGEPRQALVKYSFDRKDILSGNINDREPELSVGRGRIENVQELTNEDFLAKMAPPTWTEISGNLPRTADQTRAMAEAVVNRLPEDIKVRLTRAQPANLAPGQVIEGGYDPHTKTLYLTTAALDPIKTLRHEEIHALKDLGLFTDQEWQLLRDRAGKLEGEMDRIYRDRLAHRYEGADLEDAMAEESIARMVEGYNSGQRYGSKIDAILDRIAKFFEALRNAARGLGWRTADDVIAAIENGEVGRRKRIKLYHGSGATFREFDLGKIGTGEGSSAFGRGLYFAESEAVANTYYNMLTTMRREGKVDGDALFYVRQYGSRDAAINMLDKQIKGSDGAIQILIEGSIPSQQGHTVASYRKYLKQVRDYLAKNKPIDGAIYEVSALVERDAMLDFTRPIGEQGPRVSNAVKAAARAARERELERFKGPVPEDGYYANVFLKDDQIDAMKGGAAMELLFDFLSKNGTTEALSKNGLTGLKFADQKSRGGMRAGAWAGGELRVRAEDATFNYVFFDTKPLKINRAYQPGLGDVKLKIADRKAQLTDEFNRIMRRYDRPAALGGPEITEGELARLDEISEQLHQMTYAEKATNVKDFIRSQPERTFDQIYERAPVNQQSLVKALNEISGEFEGVTVKVPPTPDGGIKLRETAEEKMGRKSYQSTAQITDIVRAGFTATHPEPADSMVKKLAERFDIFDEGYVETPSGYIDRKVLIRFDDGMIGEIQIWEPRMFEAKMGEGVKLYTEARSLKPEDPKVAELERRQAKLYQDALDAADEAWLAALGKEGKSGKASSKASLESTRPESPTSAEFTLSQPAPARTMAQAAPGVQTAGRPSQSTKRSSLDISTDNLAQRSLFGNTELTPTGEQYVLPGAEKISDKQLAERLFKGGKKSGKPQKEAEGLPLFGDRQTDMLEYMRLQKADENVQFAKDVEGSVETAGRCLAMKG